MEQQSCLLYILKLFSISFTIIGRYHLSWCKYYKTRSITECSLADWQARVPLKSNDIFFLCTIRFFFIFFFKREKREIYLSLVEFNFMNTNCHSYKDTFRRMFLSHLKFPSISWQITLRLKLRKALFVPLFFIFFFVLKFLRRIILNNN